jgi:formiminoglutamase
MSFDLFAHTNRPDEKLFFRRDEAGDPRLGEVVKWQADDYASANVVLLDCPQDEGVRRNGGRTGAAAAPDAICNFLYRLVAPAGVSLFDLGSTIIQPTLEETHDVQQQIVRQIIADGKTLISLGGGNDISYPDCAGLAQVEPDLLAFNVDAHLDVRENPIRNSGTPYRMLLEEGHLKPENFYEMAYQPFSVAESHLKYLRDKGATAYTLQWLHKRGLMEIFLHVLEENKTNAIYWGIDMDSVRVADAPGVSAPNVLGLTADELCQIASEAGRDQRSRLFEITEVNPAYDIDARTCRLAAAAIWIFMYSREQA